MPSTRKPGRAASRRKQPSRSAATTPLSELDAWFAGTLGVGKKRRGLVPVAPAWPSWSALLSFNAGSPRVYEFEAFLCGGVPVLRDARGPSLHFVSTWARSDGTSPVFRVGDDEACVTPSFGTLRAALGLGKDPRRVEPLPRAFEPTRLYERLAWLERLFFGSSLTGHPEWAGELRLLGTRAEWEDERPLLAEAPALAAHWLLQHAFFRHHAELKRALEASRTSEHPAVRELCAMARDTLAARPPSFGDDPLFTTFGGRAPGPAPADWFTAWSAWFAERDPWRTPSRRARS